MILIITAAVVALVAALAGYVRSASHDADTWHVDPLDAPSPSTPNSYRVGPAQGSHGASVEPNAVAPTVSASASDLAAAFDAVATNDARVEVVAGSAADGHVTYVQRSRTMGYPDYVSVRFIDLGDDGSTLAVFSRARFGRSDLGVNEKRVERWLAETLKQLS